MASDFSGRVVIQFNDLKRLHDASEEKADQALRALGLEGVGKAKLLIHDSPASGRTYTRGTVTHKASAPGEPPASDTAALINSIDLSANGKLSYLIHDGVAHGLPLEIGTSKMEPRPFMGPMCVWLGEQVNSIFDEFLA